MIPRLDRERLEDLLERMADELDGDWLLVGGALVAVWLSERRVTEDLDLVGLAGTQEERLRLMRFARAAGLPVEAVNSAADYYVHAIPGWESELELLRAGARGRIFRPTPTLFLLLKVGRLSEQDLADCGAMMDRARADRLELDAARVLDALARLPAPVDPGLAARRGVLRAGLDEHRATRPR